MNLPVTVLIFFLTALFSTTTSAATTQQQLGQLATAGGSCINHGATLKNGERILDAGLEYLCSNGQLSITGCVSANNSVMKVGAMASTDGALRRCQVTSAQLKVEQCLTNSDQSAARMVGESWIASNGIEAYCSSSGRIIKLGCKLANSSSGVEFGQTIDSGTLRYTCTADKGLVLAHCVWKGQPMAFGERFVNDDSKNNKGELKNDFRMMKCTADEGAVVDPDWKRTVIIVEYVSRFGENMFLRGGLSHIRSAACSETKPLASNPCAIPIRHITTVNGEMQQKRYKNWSKGDLYLDWYGAENDQAKDVAVQGTPMVWTTNEKDNLGYSPFNKKWPGLWIVDLLMDCSRTHQGWFEHKAFVNSWEHDLKRQQSCGGTAGAAVPFELGIDHPARCGFINTYQYQTATCTIDHF